MESKIPSMIEILFKTEILIYQKYVIRETRYDWGSVQYLVKQTEVLIYPKYVVRETKHDWWFD